MNSGHRPKLGQSDIVYRVLPVIIENAYTAVLPAELHSPWASCYYVLFRDSMHKKKLTLIHPGAEVSRNFTDTFMMLVYTHQ